MNAISSEWASSLLNFSFKKKLPIYRQTEASECGIACIAMIATYHGHSISLSEIRRSTNISIKGMNLSHIMSLSEKLGLTSRPVKLELEELRELSLPAILHWDLKHFVVLKSVSAKNIVVHDPAVGLRKMSPSELGKHFTGIALELAAGPDLKRKLPTPPLSLSKLAGHIKGLQRSLVQILILGCALEVIQLILPQFMSTIVDQVLPDKDSNLLILCVSCYTILIALQTFFDLTRSWIILWLGSRFAINWTGNVFSHLLKLPQDFFSKRHLGDIVSKFSAINTIQQTLTSQFVGAVIDGGMATLTLALLLFYNPGMGAIAFAGSFIYGASRISYFKIFKESNLSQISANAKMQSRLIEAIRSSETIKLLNKTPVQTARFMNAAAESVNTTIGVQRLTIIFSSINESVAGLTRLGLFFLGSWLAITSTFTPGALVAFLAYADQFSQRANNLIDYIIQFGLLRLQGERLADIALASPERNLHGSHQGGLKSFCISLVNVHFRYGDNENWAIKGLTLNIPQGESIAITGNSGSGKSTLAKIILGLLDPQIGHVTLDGVDIEKLGKTRWRDHIAAVTQEDRVFSGSIFDNIAFFDEQATLEKVEEACADAQLHEEIIAMPMGYNTLIGDMGSSLSGGQRQRLLLARAIYLQRDILLLDEATSQLDLENEGKILSKLKSKGKTLIIVAHRPETIAFANRKFSVKNARSFQLLSS